MQEVNIESGVQLFSRIQTESAHALDGIYPKLFPDGGPFGNQVVEVVFSKETDPTDWFADVIAKAVLPSSLHPEFKQSQVIFFNTEAQLNIFKLIKFMEKKLRQCSQKTAVVEQAMSRLVLLNCYTADQLEITFYNLENIIRHLDSPSLVILDNSLSQYWTRRFESSKPMLSFKRHSIQIVNELFEKVKGLNVVLMFGRSGDYQSRSAHIDYTIQIAREKLATVTDWGRNRKFKADIDLEFH
ncbi:uncharacterized protein LOC109543432 [Dendroctonus ponderosae]|uniref:DNA recombination and repair protein Rad51-like C-terminal domain-containing protein n=1 Tax=Dendroctonus ponderosae TaxID=77166 RepID=A0AAR5Q631_DENPD|nr:uncharacterized protein LOC109543432 [Dendroctonus ponderosae]